MKIVFKNVEQMNDFYDASRLNNGGGYDQPRMTVKILNHSTVYEVVYEDYDRGDFGGSKYLTIRKNGVVVFDYYSNDENGEYTRCAKIAKNISTQEVAKVLNVCNLNPYRFMDNLTLFSPKKRAIENAREKAIFKTKTSQNVIEDDGDLFAFEIE